MNIEVHPLPDTENVTRASLEGRIDAYTVNRVEEELNSLIRIGSYHLVCDMSGVEFVSSSGFKAFRRIIKMAREQGGDVNFFNLSAEVSRLFKAVGFDSEAGVYENQDDAVESLGSSDYKEKSGDIKSRLSGLLGLNKESEPEPAEKPKKDDSSLQQTQIFRRDSSLQKTVILRKPKPKPEPVESDKKFATISPVSISLYPDPSLFQNLSQLLGTIGSLIGFSSVELVNLNVAVLESCRSIAKSLDKHEKFEVNIDSSAPGFRVSMEIPRNDFNIYQNLDPKTTDKEFSGSSGEKWLLNYVDKVVSDKSDFGTRVTLSLED